jgi:hypothetical protein
MAERSPQETGGGSSPTSPLQIITTTLRRANDFVAEYHRHNGRTARNGGKLAIVLAAGSEAVGVAIVRKYSWEVFSQTPIKGVAKKDK